MGQNDKTSSTSTFAWKEILAFLGVVLVAYFGYLGVRIQIEAPIHATQTAESRLTLIPQTQPALTDVPQIISTATLAQTENNLNGVLSVRLPTLEEINNGIPTSIWTENNIDVQDMSKPDTDTYSGEAQRNIEYLLPIYWCATSLSTLDENMRSISMQFFVNGKQVPNEYIRNYIDGTSKDWKCSYHAVVLGGWNENTLYTLEVKRTISKRLYDGKSHYSAGVYNYRLIINVR
jgi:hypothetical protein